MADISKIILPNGDQHTIKDSTARSGLNNKVDKVTGKGLSTNDFTDAMESKLNGIAEGAEVNVQADWSITDSASDAFIKNKPSIPTDTWNAYYGTCTTAADTKDKAVTVSTDQNFKLRVGVIVGVKFSHTNTYSSATTSPITLNVNDTGAKNIWYNTTHSGAGNTGAFTTVYGVANRYTWYMYDGTYWVWIHFGVVSNSNTIPSAQCETAAATAAKAASCTNHTLTANTYLHFNIRYANTAASAITMNVDGSGAKPIYINGKASSSSNHTLPAGTYIAFYNGTNWYFRTDGKLPADISGDAATVNGHSVAVDVPADAKFTDTVVTKTSELTNDSNFAVDANYVHTDNNYTSTEKTKLAGVATGAEANVQSDWDETDTASDAFIKNKPTIPTIPENIVTDANYVHTDNNYSTTEKNKLSGIASNAEVNVQSDWNETDTDSDAFIKNKPTIPTVPSAATAKPVVDGTAAVGTSTKYAREDHVHPTDTSRAPTSHASTATTYGQGNASNYGHVKLSDTYASEVTNGKAANGLAASQFALYCTGRTFSYIGKVQQGSWTTQVNVTTSETTQIAHLTLSTHGRYLVIGYCQWGGSNAGYRALGFSEKATTLRKDWFSGISGAPVPSNSRTLQQIVALWDTSVSGTTIYLVAEQNSGSTLGAYNYGIRAVLIGPNIGTAYSLSNV